MDREGLYRAIRLQREELGTADETDSPVGRESGDCIGFGLLDCGDALNHIYGHTMGQVRRDFELECALIRRRDREYCAGGIGIPMCLQGIGEAVGSKLAYPEDAMGHVVEYAVADYSELDRLEQWEPESSPYVRERLEHGKRLLEAFPGWTLGTDIPGPMTVAISMRPIEMVLKDMRKDPENLHRLLSCAVDCSLKWLECFKRTFGYCYPGLADPVSTTDILGRKHFLEFSKPYLARLLDGMERICGYRPGMHICGHTSLIWGDLVEMGVDGMSIDNCESLRHAKQVLGPHMGISGNVAPVDVMRNGTIDDVLRAVRDCIRQAADSPNGYSVLTGCRTPVGTPQENIDAFYYACRRYGRGARRGQPCEAAWADDDGAL